MMQCAEAWFGGNSNPIDGAGLTFFCNDRFASCSAAILLFLAKDALDWPPGGKKCASGGCLVLNGRKSPGGNFVSSSSDASRERCHLILSVHQVEPVLPCEVVVIRRRFYPTSPCISTFSHPLRPRQHLSLLSIGRREPNEFWSRGYSREHPDHHFISVIFIWIRAVSICSTHTS